MKMFFRRAGVGGLHLSDDGCFFEFYLYTRHMITVLPITL